jgi:hypothetical protein
MAPLHGGSSAGKSDLCCGRSLDVVGRPGLYQSGPMSICFAGCPSQGPRKNDLTIYWALGPFVRSFTLLVDLGDICPPQPHSLQSAKLPHTKAMEPLAYVELMLLDQSSIASALRRLSVELGPNEKLWLTLVLQRMVSFFLLIRYKSIQRCQSSC